MSSETWDHADDYMSQTLTRETPHGVFRAVMEVDRDPLAPEFEYGCPVYRLKRGYYGYGSEVESTGYGSESDRVSGVDIQEAFSRLSEHDGYVGETVNRWLYIFHGGSCKVISSSTYYGDNYLVYDTRAMRESWGQTGEQLETSAPEADEWQAYIDGEVYGIRVERATFGMDLAGLDQPPVVVWDEIEDTDCWGYYGEEWAKQAAVEALDDAIARVAAEMLPL